MPSGRAASYYLTQRQRGVHAEDVAAVYRDALRGAFGMAEEREERAPQAGRQP